MSTEKGNLKELQDLDLQIHEQHKALEAFEPLLAEVDEPVLVLEQEVTALRKRLQEFETEERRLERSADDRRARAKTLETRLQTVRNLREEAAVHAEQDLLRRALEADEQEALSLLDQIRKIEGVLEEKEAALSEAQAELEPRRKALVEERSQAVEAMESLVERREAYARTVDPRYLRVYEGIKAGIRAGARPLMVADLTPDGACGRCFSMIPLQLQQEVRAANSLLRCEGCGVILSVSDEGDQASTEGE